MPFLTVSITLCSQLGRENQCYMEWEKVKLIENAHEEETFIDMGLWIWTIMLPFIMFTYLSEKKERGKRNQESSAHQIDLWE